MNFLCEEKEDTQNKHCFYPKRHTFAQYGVILTNYAMVFDLNLAQLWNHF
jgi:hypothetical protein